MNRITRIDAIRAELREIGRTMGGISPKTSLYAKLQVRMDTLNTDLNSLRDEAKTTV